LFVVEGAKAEREAEARRRSSGIGEDHQRFGDPFHANLERVRRGVDRRGLERQLGHFLGDGNPCQIPSLATLEQGRGDHR
jgi:hypothetical protein